MISKAHCGPGESVLQTKARAFRWTVEVLAPARSRTVPVTRAIAMDVFGSEAANGDVEPSFEAPSSSTKTAKSLAITVVGASGDLAKKKIFPALFALYMQDSLPENFLIYGYARTKMTDEEFRDMISLTLTCRIDSDQMGDSGCNDKMDNFMNRCHYCAGNYDSADDFKRLNSMMEPDEGEEADRIFYLSVPPSIFVPVAQNSAKFASSTTGYTRVIVEKPFGRDLESSQQLSDSLAEVLSEDQIYRIDHYLGKELVDNLTVLRFSNILFQPLWSRQYIRNVQFIFAEPFGTEGRGGYFDQYGIIRDIMQNHLLQVLCLFAMETPVSLDAEDVRNAKVNVLRSMRAPTTQDVVVGQYKGRPVAGGDDLPAYTDDETVPMGSTCATFAALALFIDNPRWDGVPFMMKAGKALDKRCAEIRVQFRHVPGNLYANSLGLDPESLTNELVIRVQPDEGIYFKINNKVPGLGLRLDRSKLDLSYKNRYNIHLPDAYERLILDTIVGDKRLFIRSDELTEAWKLFTPLLHKLDEQKIQPELYPYGSRGPVGAHYLAHKHNVRWSDDN